MMSLNSIRAIFVFVVALSILFSLLQYFLIPYQFYFWEIFVDLKSVSLIIFILIVLKSRYLNFRWESSGIFNWNWSGNILWFLFPVVALLASLASGYFLTEVKTGELDNTATMMLQALFDIPAIFVFSLTTIFIEELFFRSFLFQQQIQKQPIDQCVLINSILWTIYCVPDLFSLDVSSTVNIGVTVFFIFSTGILLNILWWKNTTLWYGYSLRVGISSFYSMIITSNFAESEPFSKTDSLFFYAEGVTISLIFMISAIFLYYNRRFHLSAENQEIVNQ